MRRFFPCLLVCFLALRAPYAEEAPLLTEEQMVEMTAIARDTGRPVDERISTAFEVYHNVPYLIQREIEALIEELAWDHEVRQWCVDFLLGRPRNLPLADYCQVLDDNFAPASLLENDFERLLTDLASRRHDGEVFKASLLRLLAEERRSEFARELFEALAADLGITFDELIAARIWPFMLSGQYYLEEIQDTGTACILSAVDAIRGIPNGGSGYYITRAEAARRATEKRAQFSELFADEDISIVTMTDGEIRALAHAGPQECHPAD